MRKILAYLAASALVVTALVSWPQANAADPDWDTTGDYVFQMEYLGSNYAHDVHLTQDSSDQLTGHGGHPAGGSYTYEWVIDSGSVNGSNIQFTAHYTVGADAVSPLTTMHVVGTIASDGTISGSWDDNFQGGNRTGSFMTAAGAADNTANTTLVVDPTNNQGWVFNPDAANTTPYEFTTDQHSLGEGSLYVQPISATAAHKFIAFYPLDDELVADFDSFSYDFRIAGNGDAADSNQFYVNVYTNKPGSSTFYDCRFDYVATGGSTSSFTTVTIDPTDTPTNVAGSDCPATLAEMEAGSTISGLTLNLGDTSVNDQGLAGYFDNVVLNLNNGTTTFDFEAEQSDEDAPTVPVITMPTCGETLTSADLAKIDWSDSTDDSMPVVYYYEASNASVTNPDGSFVTTVYQSGALSSSEIATAGTPEGTYYVHVKAADNEGNESAWSTTCQIIVDNTPDPEEPTAEFTVSGGGNISLNGETPKGKKAFTFELDVTGNDLGEAEGIFTWSDKENKQTCVYTDFSDFSVTDNVATFTATSDTAGCADVTVSVTDNGKSDSITVNGTSRNLTGGNVVIEETTM